MEASLLLSFLSLLSVSRGEGIRGNVQGKCSNHPLFDEEKSSHIVGETDSLPGAWPWVVSIQKPSAYDYVHLCGGSILNDRWIVTASRCFKGRESDAYNFQIVAGTNRLSDIGSQTQIRKIKQMIMHEEYNPEMEKNDIALLEMDQPLVFSDYIQPACFPDNSILISKMNQCYTSSWRAVNEDSHEPTNILQEEKVKMILVEDCNSSTWYNGAIGPYNLCAGHEHEGIDSCQGDNGGPLMCKKEKSPLFFVVGVASWGRDCAHPQSPGVYTSTQYFHSWILKTIQSKKTSNIPEAGVWHAPNETPEPLPQFEKPTILPINEISNEPVIPGETAKPWSASKPEYEYEGNDHEDTREEEEEEEEDEDDEDDDEDSDEDEDDDDEDDDGDDEEEEDMDDSSINKKNQETNTLRTLQQRDMVYKPVFTHYWKYHPLTNRPVGWKKKQW